MSVRVIKTSSKKTNYASTPSLARNVYSTPTPTLTQQVRIGSAFTVPVQGRDMSVKVIDVLYTKSSTDEEDVVAVYNVKFENGLECQMSVQEILRVSRRFYRSVAASPLAEADIHTIGNFEPGLSLCTGTGEEHRDGEEMNWNVQDHSINARTGHEGQKRKASEPCWIRGTRRLAEHQDEWSPSSDEDASSAPMQVRRSCRIAQRRSGNGESHPLPEEAELVPNRTRWSCRGDQGRNDQDKPSCVKAASAPEHLSCSHRVGPRQYDDEGSLSSLEPEAMSQQQVRKGYTLYAPFGERAEYHRGMVISEQAEDVVDEFTGESLGPHWLVQFDFGESADYTLQEILNFPTENPALRLRKRRDARHAQDGLFEERKTAMCFLPGFSEHIVEAALREVGPPYGHNQVLECIQRMREDHAEYKAKASRFRPEIGTKIRKCYQGIQYLGEITSGSKWLTNSEGRNVKCWEVTYEDGGQDDLSWNGLLKARADRPLRPHPVRGRPLYCLELFSGCGIVSQEFAERGWITRSVDLNELSNATDKADVMSLELSDLGFVPDFIWASPPCFTYSRLSGGRHRSVDTFEKTEEALLHNNLFLKTIKIMTETKRKHPHVIVVIENPVGLLKDMPLMQHFEKSFGLCLARVDYCALGREDKKPTHLWTNNNFLKAELSEFRCCPGKCPYHDGVHLISVRGNSGNFDAAAIPLALAEEVADIVHSRFVLDGIRRLDAASV